MQWGSEEILAEEVGLAHGWVGEPIDSTKQKSDAQGEMGVWSSSSRTRLALFLFLCGAISRLSGCCSWRAAMAAAGVSSSFAAAWSRMVLSSGVLLQPRRPGRCERGRSASLRERAGAIARETATPRGATASVQRWQSGRCRSST